VLSEKCGLAWSWRKVPTSCDCLVDTAADPLTVGAAVTL
jgi:hypothetical protein